MPRMSDFEAHICDLLHGFGPVRLRRMFGGAGLYADDVMFGLIAYDVLYLKADAQAVPEFEAAGSEPFTYEGKGKPVQMSYWRIPEEAFDDADVFCAWARVGLEAARRAKARKPAKKMTNTKQKPVQRPVK